MSSPVFVSFFLGHPVVDAQTYINMVYIDGVTRDVMPDSMRTHLAISIVLLPGSLRTHHAWTGHVLLKLPPRYTGPVVSRAVIVHSSVSKTNPLCLL